MKSCSLIPSCLSRAFGSLGLGLVATLAALPSAHALSHRDAPFITGAPMVDATDPYRFRSYQTDRYDFGSATQPLPTRSSTGCCRAAIA